MKNVLAIDFGGTKTSVGVFDFEGNELIRESSHNSHSMDAEEVYNSITPTIEKVFLPFKDSIVACGMAAAGPSRNRGEFLTPPNTLAWVDFPFKSRVSELIDKEVFFENDANALALGEGFMGAAVGEKNYMSMVVSTGVGGGIVVDGRLLHGNDMNAGEIGHMIIDIDGPPCGFGCYGCIEGIASGPALERKFGIPPENATMEMKHFCADKVAQMITNVVTILDLRLVTVGGSVALGFGDDFFSRCQLRFDELAKAPHAKGARIVPTGLGPTGGLMSAARVGMLGISGEL